MSRNSHDYLQNPLLSEEGAIPSSTKRSSSSEEGVVISPPMGSSAPIRDVYLIILQFLTFRDRTQFRLVSTSFNDTLVSVEDEYGKHPFSPDYISISKIKASAGVFYALLSAGWPTRDIDIARVSWPRPSGSHSTVLRASSTNVESIVCLGSLIRELASAKNNALLDDAIETFEEIQPEKESKKILILMATALALPFLVGSWIFAMMTRNALMLGNSCCATGCFLDTCETMPCSEILASSSDAQNWLANRAASVSMEWAQQQCAKAPETLCQSFHFKADFNMIEGVEAAGISMGCDITAKTGIAWTLAAVLLLICLAGFLKFRSRIAAAIQACLPATLELGATEQVPFSQASEALGFLKLLNGWKAKQTEEKGLIEQRERTDHTAIRME